MDVGAAFGTFCSVAQEYDVFDRVTGIEPTPHLAARCRALGIETIEETIEEVDLPDESVDVITNFEVIEHLFSPRDFLKNCYRLLSQDGLFVVTCPNYHGFDVGVLGEKATCVDHEHLNYFNPESLGALLEEIGFDVVDVRTPGVLDAELVRNKVLSGEHTLNDWFLQKVLIDEWEDCGAKFQEFLIENKMSSNMWLVGRKARC